MRKYLLACFVGFGLLLPVAASAQSSFLLGMVVGMGMSSDSSSSVGGADASLNLLYLAPRAAERVKDPLMLQVAASDCDQHGRNTIGEIFRKTVYDADKHKEILQVTRVSGASKTNCTSLWFVFTSPSNLIPLDKLPSLAQK